MSDLYYFSNKTKAVMWVYRLSVRLVFAGRDLHIASCELLKSQMVSVFFFCGEPDTTRQSM